MKKKHVPSPPPAAPKPARAEASTTAVLRFQLQEQQGRTLRMAEQLLQELEALVERLRAGDVPTTTVNPNTISFLVADHARLVTLKDTLEMIETP